ncbi:unnamed protein product [Cylicocyclus nassatus]|uniref:Ig-like domain-containing protein n=1 Tax=Cylicocyclus nassatus TaxID=53992 RepID=A0AA36MDL4_CYLNA|nr:unnamed protein product [Cylicocyclus nassatus]
MKICSFVLLVVADVTPDAEEEYECKGNNKYGQAKGAAKLLVRTAFYWPDGPPPNTNTSEGQTVTFDCTTSGKPEPKVTFYKNGVEMEKPKDDDIWMIDTTRLTIY